MELGWEGDGGLVSGGSLINAGFRRGRANQTHSNLLLIIQIRCVRWNSFIYSPFDTPYKNRYIRKIQLIWIRECKIECVSS